jgi:TonB family protein
MIPALTIANFLAWSIQVAAIVLVGGGAIHLARLQPPRVRLACLRALLVACLLLPFLPSGAIDSPKEVARTAGPSNSQNAGRADSSGAPVLSVDVTAADGPAAASGEGRGAWLPAWAVAAAGVIFGLGAAARLVWLLVGLLALRRLRRHASKTIVRTDRSVCPPYGRAFFDSGARPFAQGRRGAPPTVIDRAIDLAGATADVLTSSAVNHPVTFGLRRPVVLLPDSYASLDESEQVAVVCHELLHVRRRDWLQTVAEEIVRAVLWFHPAIWWLLAQFDLSREQLVDQEVVALTARRQPYVNALVTLALTPVGPILRPASLFLGRAHLIQRVALLSREVRMSRPRLCLSLALVIVALIVGGQFVVHAFPLTAAAPSLASTTAIAPPAPAVAPTALPVPANASLPPSAPLPAPQSRPYPGVLQRFEPVVPVQPSQPGVDTIMTMQVTVQPSGELVMSGPVEIFAGQPGNRAFEAKASRAEGFQRMLDQGMTRLASGATYGADEARAAFDALRTWQFVPGDKPFTTVVGFNFARGDQSGAETPAVRIGGDVRAPTRIRNVQPVYPADAQAKGIQGVVILELTIDGAGIPIIAYGVRPIEGLTMAAAQAALQWRFEPDAAYSRRLMTVTVNFTLDGVQGGVAGGVAGGVVGGVVGGVQGGVVGGVVTGGISTSSFGPPRSEWSNAIRVGGEIKVPTRIVNVNPIYPAIAQSAKVQGVVIVEVLIGPDGTVQAAQILRSIPLLDQAALDAVRQWQYTPTLLNGMPISVVMTCTVNFTLQ